MPAGRLPLVPAPSSQRPGWQAPVLLPSRWLLRLLQAAWLRPQPRRSWCCWGLLPDLRLAACTTGPSDLSLVYTAAQPAAAPPSGCILDVALQCARGWGMQCGASFAASGPLCRVSVLVWLLCGLLDRKCQHAFTLCAWLSARPQSSPAALDTSRNALSRRRPRMLAQAGS